MSGDRGQLAPKAASAFPIKAVTPVRHWTETLFSFRASCDPGFHFQSGQFVMMGLTVDDRPQARAYSIGSPS